MSDTFSYLKNHWEIGLNTEFVFTPLASSSNLLNEMKWGVANVGVQVDLPHDLKLTPAFQIGFYQDLLMGASIGFQGEKGNWEFSFSLAGAALWNSRSTNRKIPTLAHAEWQKKRQALEEYEKCNLQNLAGNALTSGCQTLLASAPPEDPGAEPEKYRKSTLDLSQWGIRVLVEAEVGYHFTDWFALALSVESENIYFPSQQFAQAPGLPLGLLASSRQFVARSFLGPEISLWDERIRLHAGVGCVFHLSPIENVPEGKRIAPAVNLGVEFTLGPDPEKNEMKPSVNEPDARK